MAAIVLVLLPFISVSVHMLTFGPASIFEVPETRLDGMLSLCWGGGVLCRVVWGAGEGGAGWGALEGRSSHHTTSVAHKSRGVQPLPKRVCWSCPPINSNQSGLEEPGFFILLATAPIKDSQSNRRRSPPVAIGYPPTAFRHPSHGCWLLYNRQTQRNRRRRFPSFFFGLPVKHRRDANTHTDTHPVTSFNPPSHISSAATTKKPPPRDPVWDTPAASSKPSLAGATFEQTLEAVAAESGLDPQVLCFRWDCSMVGSQAGLSFRTQIFFLLRTAVKDSPPGPPTAKRQPPK